MIIYFTILSFFFTRKKFIHQFNHIPFSMFSQAVFFEHQFLFDVHPNDEKWKKKKKTSLIIQFRSYEKFSFLLLLSSSLLLFSISSVNLFEFLLFYFLVVVDVISLPLIITTGIVFTIYTQIKWTEQMEWKIIILLLKKIYFWKINMNWNHHHHHRYDSVMMMMMMFVINV